MEREDFNYNGLRMSYQRRRGKYPVVFIHGFTASSEIWSPMIDKLDPEFDLIMVDLLGHGLSEFPDMEGVDVDVDTVIRFQASAIADLISRLDLKKFVVVGSSLGGWISMELSVNMIRPSGLILIDTAGVAPFSDKTFRTGLEDLAGCYTSGNSRMAPVLGRILEGVEPDMTLMNEDLIRKVDFDISVIWGTDDPILNVKFGEAFSKKLKDHCFHAIKNAGHTPFTDKPEEVAEIINRFVLKTVGK